MKNRLKEPSTFAGLAVLLAQAGKLLFPEFALVLDGLAAVAGGAAVVMTEKGVAR